MKRTVKVVGALMFENGKIFAAKRGASSYSYVAHKYEFPGGKIERGETPEAALSRELKEELSLEGRVGGLYAKTIFEYPDFIVDLSVYEFIPTTNFTLNEHESYAWLAPRDLEEGEWAPADADILGTIRRVFGGIE